MIDRTHSIIINRPPAEVFAYVTDPHKTGEWDPKVISARVEPPGKLAVGSKIVQRVRLPVRTVEGSFEIAGYEPGVEIVYRSDSSYFTGDITFRVEAAGEGTKLIIRESGGSRGLLRPVEPLLARSGIREREHMMEIMKERLEAQGEGYSAGIGEGVET